MRAIRFGITGCGDVTSGPGFQKAEHSQLAAVMRPSTGESAARTSRVMDQLVKGRI